MLWGRVTRQGVATRQAAPAWRPRPPLSNYSAPIIARRPWMGSSESTRISPFISATSRVQCRDYIFLPASFSDASKQLKPLFDNNEQPRQRLRVKVQNRWQDTLFNVQARIEAIQQNQRTRRKYARQRAHAARTSMLNRSAKYSLFVTNMRGKVGTLSSTALSRGKRHLLSHYYAKKRVYARRKMVKYLTRKMGGNRTLVERWKMKYALLLENRNSGWGWRNADGSLSQTTWRGITLTEPAQQSWFDAEGFPLTSRDPDTGRFVNPWSSESTNGAHGLRKFLKWRCARWVEAVRALARKATCEQNGRVPRERTPHRMSALSHSALPSTSSHQDSPPVDVGVGVGVGEQERIDLTWLGHSSTLVTFPGNFTVLTDPHFSNYAGPVRRNAPPAVSVVDLPEVVDCVLISHDHMDHLDYWTILELIESSKVKYWIVPLGIKAWLLSKCGCSPEDIIELEWWEGVRISKAPQHKAKVEGLVHAFDHKTTGRRHASRGTPHKNELLVTCCPAQHWCSRTPLDRNRRLWCSFAVHATPARSPTHSFYFAGDTGLPPEFPLHHQIGDRLGPFDLAAIPIGAYEPEWFMRESHCNPAEAVSIHQAIRSRRSVAVHFDTFDLADEPREEPPQLLLDAVSSVNKKIGKMRVAVADELGIDTGLEQITSLPVNDNESSLSLRGRATAAEAKGQFVELLPQLVDFAVIRQGQSIGSSPK